MLLGVLSDSHGHMPNTQRAVRMLESCEVEQVLHCGDIGSAQIVSLFQRWPTHFVLGNVDDQPGLLQAAIEQAGQTFHGRFGKLEVADRRIALLHGDDTQRLREAIDSGNFDLVCYGHTHVAEHHREGATLVLNPGALYRASPHTLALVQLPDLLVTHIPL